MAAPPSTWSPSSWRSIPAEQQPEWPDSEHARDVRERLLGMPPLVFAGEARNLQATLAEVAAGRGFLLQAGDCAESFGDFSAVTIREKLKIMLQMAAVLTYGAMLPVAKVGRIAGQFTKPRSSPVETVDGIEIPSFRGHMVHDDAPTLAARTPDPERMVQGYHQSAATLNLLRAFTKGGFADLTKVHLWNQEFVASSPEGRRYERIAAEIERALAFMAACGIDLERERRLHEVDVWTSHEGILLDYEEALTRRDSLTGRWYDCSAHMLWVGERTRARRRRPRRVLRRRRQPARLQGRPHGDAGRGARPVRAARPRPHARPAHADLPDGGGPGGRRAAADRAGRDRRRPSGGVGVRSHARERLPHPAGYKTRRFEDIMAEIGGFFAVCREAGVWPGGVHLEFTGEDVTECLGGADSVLEDQLSVRYHTLCDPRLNARQSLDLAFRLAELMRSEQPAPAPGGGVT